MRKHLWIIIISAVFLCLAANSAVASIPNDPAYETGLQQASDDRTAGGEYAIEGTVDMAKDDPDSYRVHTAAGRAGSTILFAIAGYADTNSFGIYDRADMRNTLQFFSGRDAAADYQSITFDGMAEGDYLFLGRPEHALFAEPSFGFYLDVADENARWYSDAYHPRQSSEYILAWEDPAEQNTGRNYSFNDFVVMIDSVIPSPMSEPATMFLFGAGLAGLASIGLRRRERKA